MTSDPYFLSKGVHASAEEGRCAMEWTAYIAGELHSDQPVCVSPVLRTFCIGLNDAMGDEERQRLRPYLARCIGTAGDGRDRERGEMCLDWLVRVYTPAWLDLVPSLRAHAEALRNMPEGLVVEDTARALELIRPAQKDAAAAWDAVRAAGAAAAAAAWAAALDAAGDAARAAAWDAAGDAARAAARDAAGDGARAAARAAARTAAGDAARAAAWAAARPLPGAAAWDAVRDAGRDALDPTVRMLQDSALDLLDRMLPGEIIQLPVVEERVWRELVASA